MPVKYFLVEGTGESDYPGYMDILDVLQSNFNSSHKFSISEVEENDILIPPPNIDQGGSVELGRRKINLRKSKEFSLPIGSICKLKGIEGPTMLVEDIDFRVDTGKKYEVAKCVWFKDSCINSSAFNVDVLEVIKDSSTAPMSVMSRLIKDHPVILQYILDGQNINAIKVIREVEGLGLKEAKDLVDDISQMDIVRWKAGIYK